jgi:hypothetical protein
MRFLSGLRSRRPCGARCGRALSPAGQSAVLVWCRRDAASAPTRIRARASQLPLLPDRNVHTGPRSLRRGCNRSATDSRPAAIDLQYADTRSGTNRGEAACAIPGVFGAFRPCALGFAGLSSIGETGFEPATARSQPGVPRAAASTDDAPTVVVPSRCSSLVGPADRQLDADLRIQPRQRASLRAGGQSRCRECHAAQARHTVLGRM